MYCPAQNLRRVQHFWGTAASMLQKTAVKDLKVGMFVADLDRPWMDTPFLLQGFMLENAEEIAQLQAHCQWVLIDPVRS
ncbi:MAG: DUF3391 domain-containing protein, partial [Burkholderiales bacterium]